MSPPPPIPDWIVRAAGWLELIVIGVLALSILYGLWTATRALRGLTRASRRRAHPYGSPTLQGPTAKQIRRAQRTEARRRRT